MLIDIRGRVSLIDTGLERYGAPDYFGLVSFSPPLHSVEVQSKFRIIEFSSFFAFGSHIYRTHFDKNAVKALLIM